MNKIHILPPYLARRSAVYATIYSELGELVCFIGMSEVSQQTAEFIVRACNAHDNLVKALDLALRHNEHGTLMTGEELRAGRSALATAMQGAVA